MTPSPAPNDGEILAGIDCGTNTIRLLIARRSGNDLVRLDRRMETVRLGEGVDRTGELSAAALERTWGACDRYGAAIRDAGVARLRFVATSASRDAKNAAAFVAGVQARLGVAPEVVPGSEEATLSFTGATRGSDLERPALVFDIGGGSTEFVLGDETPQHSLSVDIGCVRLTERMVTTDPLSTAQIADIEATVAAALGRVAEVVPLTRAESVVGLAGTVTTVAAMALGLTAYDSQRIHGTRLSRAQVDAVVSQLLAATISEREQIPVMQSGRADVIVAGALILRAVMARADASELVVSEHDILDGIVWSLID